MHISFSDYYLHKLYVIRLLPLREFFVSAGTGLVVLVTFGGELKVFLLQFGGTSGRVSILLVVLGLSNDDANGRSV